MKLRKFVIFLFISLLAYCPCITLIAQNVTLLFAGDAMQHQTQIDNAYRNGKYDYSSYFRYIKDKISSADISIVNLEVTLGGKPYKGYPMFSAPDEYAIALKEAGFDIFLTANNHCLDRFSKGLERTIYMLDSLQVKHTGTFVNADQRERRHPLMVTKNGIRMAFLNYTYGTNGMEVSAPNIVNYIDTIQIKTDILQARLLNADIIIANMHWGDEYKLVQNKEQEKLARFLIDNGVKLVIGSHPHVVQPSEIFKDKDGNISNLIVYSLGNFISGMKVVNTDGGQMIKVVVSKNRIKSCSYELIFVDKQYNDGKIDFTLLPVKRFEKHNDTILNEPYINLDPDTYKKMAVFTQNARDLFDKYNNGVYELNHKENDIPKVPLFEVIP